MFLFVAFSYKNVAFWGVLLCTYLNPKCENQDSSFVFTLGRIIENQQTEKINMNKGVWSGPVRPVREFNPPPPELFRFFWKRGRKKRKQDVREAYAYFFPEQECDPVTVLI